MMTHMPSGPDKGRPLNSYSVPELRVLMSRDWVAMHDGPGQLQESIRAEINRQTSLHACPNGMEIDWDNPETMRILDAVHTEVSDRRADARTNSQRDGGSLD